MMNSLTPDLDGSYPVIVSDEGTGWDGPTFDGL